jgi:hypothetical protein
VGTRYPGDGEDRPCRPARGRRNPQRGRIGAQPGLILERCRHEFTYVQRKSLFVFHTSLVAGFRERIERAALRVAGASLFKRASFRTCFKFKLPVTVSHALRARPTTRRCDVATFANVLFERTASQSFLAVSNRATKSDYIALIK